MGKKQIKQDIIFKKQYNSINANIRFKDLDYADKREDDIIDIHRDENYDNEQWDSYTKVCVYREREETDEEYEERINENRKFQEELRKRRYENYLKLKKEFENE